jgi:transposase
VVGVNPLGNAGAPQGFQPAHMRLDITVMVVMRDANLSPRLDEVFARPVFAAHGHDVRLMSPEYVRPYVKAQKNDDRDAEGIAEAATRPTMRFVEVKSEAQLDMQTLHRSRDRLVGERTALINQLRAILLERGLVVPQGKRKLEQYLVTMMDEHDGCGLSVRIKTLVATCARSGVSLIDASQRLMRSSCHGRGRMWMPDGWRRSRGSAS